MEGQHLLPLFSLTLDTVIATLIGTSGQQSRDGDANVGRSWQWGGEDGDGRQCSTGVERPVWGQGISGGFMSSVEGNRGTERGDTSGMGDPFCPPMWHILWLESW